MREERAVSLHPDGIHAVSDDRCNCLRVWDIEAGRCLRILKGPAGGIWAGSVSADGQFVLSASSDNTLRIWHLETGQCQIVYHAGAAVTCATFIPSGEQIVCGTADGQMHFLTFVNLEDTGPAIVTSVLKRRQRWFRKQVLEARCPYCWACFDLDAAFGSSLRELSEFGSSNKGSSNSTRLLAACPHCAKPLKFNPFFVDRG